jgi:hypothetical protein
MELRVRCIDARFSKRQGNHKLIMGHKYTVIGLKSSMEILTKTNKAWIMENKVLVKEVPGVEYLSRRFEILDKELNITLPDDFEAIPL